MVSSGFPAAILVRHQAASSNYSKIMTQERDCQYIGLKPLIVFHIYFKREIRPPLIALSTKNEREISIFDDSVTCLLTEAVTLCEIKPKNITKI